MSDNPTTTPSSEDRIAKLEKALEVVMIQNETILQENAELKKATAQTEAAAPEKLEIPAKAFSVKGQEYKFVCPAFMHKGVRVLAKDALTDRQLLEYLVRKGSELVKAV